MTSNGISAERLHIARVARARRIVALLKQMYPVPKTELLYKTNFQLVVAVMLSAQCTDKRVNIVTRKLFAKYKTVNDFASATVDDIENIIKSVTYFRTKSRHIVATAKIVSNDFGGSIPRSVKQLCKLPGIGYKSANVILGELFDIWQGIATDTHVSRLVQKFNLTSHDDPTKISKDLESIIPYKDWKYVNNGLVLYGRYICKASKHDCNNHPLTKVALDFIKE